MYVSPSDAIQSDGFVSSTVHQNQLSSKIDIHQFNNILTISSVADKARLLSVSSPHAASWLTVVPSEGLGLHLEPSVFQVAVKWWLGLDTSNGSLCALCPNNALDPLGHHATTCKKGGDVVTRHNQLRNVLAETCRRAHLSIKVEMGSNLTFEHDHSRPADMLLPNRALGKPAAFDISVTSPLNPKIISVAGLSAGAAALSTEERKHTENDPKCNALGWCCVPLVTESYGAWGKEAMDSFKMLASRLAIISGKPKSVVLSELYSRLNLHLDGLYSKACQTLVSSSLAPNNAETWRLLEAKHPKGECPKTPSPTDTSTLVPAEINLMAILRSFPKLSAAGPSGLHIQHLIDAAEVPLQTPILHLLRAVINLLATGKAPIEITAYLAGGNLTALNKSKPGCPFDVWPIAVGEALRRLVGKCLSAAVKVRAQQFFHPFQFGVACPLGAEQMIHGLRDCIEQHWLENDFVVLKVDLKNAFNMVSRQAVLNECGKHFPELLPWASWCYSQHPFLWHPLGCLTSEQGVQQGDPLGPLLFSLVLNILVSEISSRGDCSLNYHAWYLDDGALAGPGSSVYNILAMLQELGDAEFCHHYIAHKRLEAQSLLSRLDDVGLIDPQVALTLLLVPSQGLGLHLDPPVHQIAIQWWLGLDTSQGSQCALCPGIALDPLGHHAITCKRGGDVVTRHNTLRDVLAEICHRAHLGVQVEAGNDLTADHSHTRPADLLLTNWATGKTAAFDISVTSSLNTLTLLEAGVSAGSAAQATETRKHMANDAKCNELGWLCVPLVAETYGAWGKEAMEAFSQLASRLATHNEVSYYI
ncbi:hypothetical protein EMCRGX_G019610 [Ephydatia muelleri]